MWNDPVVLVEQPNCGVIVDDEVVKKKDGVVDKVFLGEWEVCSFGFAWVIRSLAWWCGNDRAISGERVRSLVMWGVKL